MVKLYEKAIQLNSTGKILPPPVKHSRPTIRSTPKEKGLAALRAEHPWPSDIPKKTPFDTTGSSSKGYLSKSCHSALNRTLPTKTSLIVHLGAWRGEATRALADICSQATIVCVDPWCGGNTDQKDYPCWHGMLPEVWHSFLDRCHDIRERIIPLSMHHPQALGRLKQFDLYPEVIYFQPDYDTAAIRATMAAIEKFFPESSLLGRNWMWAGFRDEVTKLVAKLNRPLEVDGNFWHIPSGQAIPSNKTNSISDKQHATNGSTSHSNALPNVVEKSLVVRKSEKPRVLITIPHYYRPDSSKNYGSGAQKRSQRASALQACVQSLCQHLDCDNYLTNLVQPDHTPANASTGAELDFVFCVHGDNHVFEALPNPERSYRVRSVQGEPMELGFACHEVLRKELGNYDYYVYLEDDLIIHDPWLMTKIEWFRQQAGEDCLLQPNRFEFASSGKTRKAYIDGNLPFEKTTLYQDISNAQEILADFCGKKTCFQRTSNPHAGCFFLSAEQMDRWSRKSYYLDREASFYSPLESAATLGIMKTFKVYKPAASNANFLEIQHAGDDWLNRIAQRDANVLGGFSNNQK